jgi:hypothetical protein
MHQLMAAIEPLIAAEAMKSMHVPLLILVAVSAVGAGLVKAVRSVRSRDDSAKNAEHDQRGET